MRDVNGPGPGGRLSPPTRDAFDQRVPFDASAATFAALLLSTYLFLLTPVLHSIVRGQEYEADIFGLNAAGKPDGFAQTALKLSEYRKLDPGPLEELFFYDHPSGRTRIFAAMRWKAEHPETWATAGASK